MKISIAIAEDEIKQVLLFYIEGKVGISLKKESVKFLVKSQQNFRAEWEEADFKVEIDEFGVK